MNEQINLILDIVLLAVYGYSIYFCLSLTKKIYGGRFTSVLPPLLAATGLLFSIHILHRLTDILPIDPDLLIVSVQMLQIVAGVLLIKALYQMYQIGFATSGFFRGK